MEMTEIEVCCDKILKQIRAIFEYNKDENIFIIDKIYGYDKYRLILKVYEEQNWLLCFALWPEEIKITNRIKVIEFINEANIEIKIGNFVYNTNNCLVKFKNSIDIEGVKLNKKILANLMMCCISMIEEYEEQLISLNR